MLAWTLAVDPAVNLAEFASVAGIDQALAPGGTFVIEAHYFVDLLHQLAFDTVYHEHVSCWALGPMVRLFEQYGMEVVGAERLALHHGQLRVAVRRRGEGRVDPGVGELPAMEDERGIGPDLLEFRNSSPTAAP